jgi:hypothetical protein
MTLSLLWDWDTSSYATDLVPLLSSEPDCSNLTEIFYSRGWKLVL